LENLTPVLPSGRYSYECIRIIRLVLRWMITSSGSKVRAHKKRVMQLNKKILTFCFFVFLFLPLISYSEDKSEISSSKKDEKPDTLKICDRWLAWDKVKHFGVSAYFSAISYKIFRDFYHNREESSLYFSGGFTYKDLVADILGIGLGLWIATR
jgi:uncharacterized protein YfiM (DUF2279 family)